jgi:hypothetical protein
MQEYHQAEPLFQPNSSHTSDKRLRRNDRSGSGTEIPCASGTSGSMRIAAFELRFQECQDQSFDPPPALIP